MSLCQEESREVLTDAKKKREEEIQQKVRIFFRNAALNLCITDGITGKLDMALGINRNKIIANVLRDLAKDLENS